MAKQGILGSLDQFNHDPMSVFGNGVQSGMGTPGMPIDPTPLADNWQPHHVTVLGALADAYLRSRGQQPIFQAKKESDNMQEAMANYATDPLQAIRRLARIPGHEAEAAKLYQSYTDDQRMQHNLDRQNQLFDLKLEEIVRDRTAGILGTITPTMDDATKSRVIQRAKSYAQGKGFTDIADSIPDNASMVDIDSIRFGEIPIVKQEGLERTDRRLDQSDRRLDQGDRRLTETEEHHDATEQQAAVNEQGRNARNATNEAGRNSRHATPAAKPTARNVMTKYGVGQVNKDGTKMLIQRGGKYFLYLNAGSVNGKTNWVPQGEVQPK